jgi:hypothetical protein
MGWMTAAAIGAPIIGGVIGNIASAKDRRRAQEAMQRAFAEINQLPDVGPDAAKHIVFRSLEDAGVLTPELEKAIEMDAPQLSKIAADPDFLKKEAAGTRALQRMAETGFDSRAQYEQARLRGLQERRKELASIEQAEQQAGRIGGAGLAAKIAGGVSSSANIAEQALQASAEQERAKREALGMYMQQMGTSEERRLGLEKTRRGALDEFNRAMAADRRGVQQRNVGAQREAQRFNIGTRQADIQQRLAQDAQRAAAERQLYEDRVRMANMRANAQMGQATQYQQQAGQTAGMWSGIGTGVGQAAMYAGMYGQKAAPQSSQSGSSGWNWSNPINNAMDAAQADEAARQALIKYGYPGKP